ncbi:MAG: CHAT domain-containing protein [Anaerolineae bacterium]
MSYQNFAIEISALPDGKYRIEVQSPVGEASVDAASRFTPEELASYLQIFSREKRVPRQEELNAARDFGQRLFNFVFHASSDISSAYFASLRDAGTSDGLRIRLTVDKAGALSGLPWEFLRDPVNDYLALSRRTPIVRHPQQLNSRPPATISLPLRVLVMISAPQDFPALDVEGEWTRLQEATAPLRERGLLQLDRLEAATLIALQRRLRAEDYHVLHYVGHSDYDPASQQGLLVFENERDPGKGQIISGTALSREIAEESTVRLVVLNSCHSASRPPADALAGIASSIVTRGIPAVVAMQFAITDGAAKAFAEEFYRTISDLMPLDAAMSEARRAIANRVGNSEWATPVLFMRSEDGVLFRTEAKTSGAIPTPPLPTPVVTPQRDNRNRSLSILTLILLLIALGVSVLSLTVFNPPAPTPTPTTTLVPIALPDLQIGNLRTSTRNPIPGQIFILSISITNAGAADSGAFDWAWDASTTPPILTNSLSGHIDNIPPGASKNISFPFSYGWWGTYNSQLRVDAQTQVNESDESNNFRFFQVSMANVPFEVDFSLLPTNLLVEPPLTLDPALFDLWNLHLAVNAASNPDCADTPLLLVEQDDDILLTVGGDDPDCQRLPLSITVLRAPVSAALLEIIPAANGTATYTYYSDDDGQQVLFASPAIDVQAGEKVQLTPGDATARRIQRIDVSAPGQVVRLTRLLLSPPNP